MFVFPIMFSKIVITVDYGMTMSRRLFVHFMPNYVSCICVCCVEEVNVHNIALVHKGR